MHTQKHAKTTNKTTPTSGMYLTMYKTQLFVFHISVKSEDSLVACGTKVSSNYINSMCLLVCIVTRQGAGRSSEVERSLMVRWVVGSILHGVDPLSYFSFQPVLHDWYNKGRGMCYPVCGMVHIKEPLLLIGKSSPCGGSGFPLSLSEWSLTICLTPNNRR